VRFFIQIFLTGGNRGNGGACALGFAPRPSSPWSWFVKVSWDILRFLGYLL